MNNIDEKIHASRMLLRNPYAYLDGEGGYSAAVVKSEVLTQAISAERFKLENPHAFASGDGSYDAKLVRKKALRTIQSLFDSENIQILKIKRGARKLKQIEIDKVVKDIHETLWINRNKLLSEEVESKPWMLLEPEIVFKHGGYDYVIHVSLPKVYVGGKELEAAGIIDKDNRMVNISNKYPLYTQRFTAAHELGHAVLHAGTGLHRDIPIDNSEERKARDVIEIEADKFASSFLMPKNLVIKIFKEIFLTSNFVITDHSMFALGYDAHNSTSSLTRRELSRLLASASSYNGVSVIPLHKLFRVSVEAMAIRIEELKLC